MARSLGRRPPLPDLTALRLRGRIGVNIERRKWGGDHHARAAGADVATGSFCYLLV